MGPTFAGILFAGLFLFTSTAHADWLEASSDHFVIYGDQNETQVRQFGERLERFHAAMASALETGATRPSSSNRVTIFAVSSASKVREVAGIKNRYVAGAYFARAGASVAIIPKLKGARSQFELSGETILYHEYAHHFMMTGLTNRVFPRWFVEGFAEFFAGVRFDADGGVKLGVPPAFRAPELFFAREVPMRTLLSFDGGYGPKSGNDSFYGQSWVLFHYLQLEKARSGQLLRYEQGLAAGKPALEVAESAFGDLKQLEKDLDAYLKRRKVSVIKVPKSWLVTGPVVVRKLRAGEAAMMPVLMESKLGVNREEALSLAPEARKVATRFPDDPTVLSALAEAEFDAGNYDAAIAAADRALTIDPQLINAHLQRGYALKSKVKSGALPKESWKDVRTQFVKANQVENDHPIPLVQFYLSYLAQHEKPTKNAIDGLEWAMQLAPFDASLRWLVVQQMVADQRFDVAAQTLAPLAYSPHQGEHTDAARKLLEELSTRLQAREAAPTDSPAVQ